MTPRPASGSPSCSARPPAGRPSTSGLPWARVAAAVPGFAGSTTFAIEVPCTYDLEVAAAKYFYAVQDGEVPLSFHFNGNIFYHGPGGRLQVLPVSWTSTAQYKLPVATWRAMIAEHYPGGGWIRIDDDDAGGAQRPPRARADCRALTPVSTELLGLAGERSA